MPDFGDDEKSEPRDETIEVQLKGHGVCQRGSMIWDFPPRSAMMM
jgi:hypothetical protein